jgi:hypothetical protein
MDLDVGSGQSRTDWYLVVALECQSMVANAFFVGNISPGTELTRLGFVDHIHHPIYSTFRFLPAYTLIACPQDDDQHDCESFYLLHYQTRSARFLRLAPPALANTRTPATHPSTLHPVT